MNPMARAQCWGLSHVSDRMALLFFGLMLKQKCKCLALSTPLKHSTQMSILPVSWVRVEEDK